MSVVALILNLLLGALLVAALLLGWRLERRLRALKDSQANFTQAVADLDRAATRAEQGLADLRAATDEAAEALAGRIERARELSQRLDAVMSRAPATPAAAPAESAGPRIRGEPRELRQLRAELREIRAEPREVRTDLILEDAPPRRPFSAERAAARFAAAPPAPSPSPQRSRARVDDDLFDESPAARRPVLGERPLGDRR